MTASGFWLSACAGLAISGAAMADAPLNYVFAGKAATGQTKVEGAPAYDAALGYGFISQPGGNEQAFSVKLAPGDYRVEVTLGGTPKPSRTAIWAESRRLMVAPVALKAKETKTISFVVNVRDAFTNSAETDPARRQKITLKTEEVSTRNWDDHLTLSVSGEAPALKAINITPVTARRILLVGDSTVTDQSGRDYASWGQMLPRFLSNDVAVANYAWSGLAIKTFMGQRWAKVLSELRPGDIVVIQFAHNDEKKQNAGSYSSSDLTFPGYLLGFAGDVKQRGGVPVLVTPVARRIFKDGKIEDTHGEYDDAVRDLGAHYKLPVIDLTVDATTLYQALGDAPSAAAFANDGKDRTHHNAYGAYTIACYVAHDLAANAALGVKLAADVPTCDPAKPADPQNYELKPTDWPVMTQPATGAQTPAGS